MLRRMRTDTWPLDGPNFNVVGCYWREKLPPIQQVGVKVHAVLRPEGRRTMSAGAADAAAAALLPTVEIRALKAHRGPLQFARFNKSGRYAITGGQDRSIILWNPYRAGDDETGALVLKEYRGHGYEVVEACMSDANDRIGSVGGDKCAYVWDVITGKSIRKFFGHEQRLSCCDFNPEGTMLLTGSNDKTVRAWDLKSASRTPIQVLEGFADNVTRVIARDGEILAACMDGHIRRFDLRTGKCFDDTVGAGVASAAVSNDGNCVLAATFRLGGNLVLMDKLEGMQLKEYTGHANSLYRCCPGFTSDDAHVMCGGEDGSVHFWDLVSGSLVHQARPHSRVVSWVEHHPDPTVSVMLTASYDGTAKLHAKPGTDLRALSLVDPAADTGS